jgi:hypothetical protein
MIDLDAIEDFTEGTELYCVFGSLLALGKLSYVEWNTCVRALGIHRYVLPRDRVLYDNLLDTAYFRRKKESAALMQQALLMSHVEAHYTETEQIKILGYILYREDCQMEKSPENCGTIGKSTRRNLQYAY